MLRRLAYTFGSLKLQSRPSFQCRYTGLPPELLAGIFLYLDFFDMVAVTHVCANWRAIAINYHKLWTTIEAGRNPAELAKLLERTKHLKRIRLVLWDRFPSYAAPFQTLISRNQAGKLDAIELTGEVHAPADFAALDSVAGFLTYLHLRVPYREYPWHEESDYEETDVETPDAADWSAAAHTRILIPVPLSLFPGQIAGQLRTLILGRGVKLPDSGFLQCLAFTSVERLDYTMHFLVLEDLSAIESMFPSLKHLRLRADSSELHDPVGVPAYGGRELISFDLVFSPSNERFSCTEDGVRIEPIVLHFFTGPKARHTRLRYHVECVDRATDLWWNVDDGDDDASQSRAVDVIIRARDKIPICATFDLRTGDGRTIHVHRYPAVDARLSVSPMWGGLRRLTVSRTWIAGRFLPPFYNLAQLVVLFENEFGGSLTHAFSNPSTGRKTKLDCPFLRDLILAPDPQWAKQQLSLSAGDILGFLNDCLQLSQEPLEVLCLQNIELLALGPDDIAELRAAVRSLKTAQSPVKLRFEEEEAAWWYEREVNH